VICERPFAKVARELEVDEQEVLREVQNLKDAGVIRRIGASVNYRALGLASTLVAANVPSERLEDVTRAVNKIEGVSHNYLREQYYNMWFTLQEASEGDIERRLADLTARIGIAFYSLPVERVFKLDVRFDAERQDQVLQSGIEPAAKMEKVEITGRERLVLAALQRDLEVVSEPFAFLAYARMSVREALGIVRGLADKGVIRRIVAVVDHRKLGFTANAMFVAEAANERIVRVGRNLARLNLVSHCYQRRTFEGWAYNLFAMMHGRTMKQICDAAEGFAKQHGIGRWELLATLAELKKQPMRWSLR
jgi:DNA-binding Lrp family transcriptional regulator